jgi:hypothetical protein
MVLLIPECHNRGLGVFHAHFPESAILGKERGRNGFDGLELVWKGVPGSELPLNDRKTKTANTQFAYAA